MKKIASILFLGLFYCLTSNAQINLVFDELQIEQVVYIHTAKEYYDSITENHVRVILCTEYDEPMFVFNLTVENNTDKDFVFDTSDYSFYATFEVNNKPCKVMITVCFFKHDNIIPPFSKQKLRLSSLHFLSLVRESETNERIELPYTKLEDRNDYSNIIYSILPTLRMVYIEKFRIGKRCS